MAQVWNQDYLIPKTIFSNTLALPGTCFACFYQLDYKHLEDSAYRCVGTPQKLINISCMPLWRYYIYLPYWAMSLSIPCQITGARWGLLAFLVPRIICNSRLRPLLQQEHLLQTLSHGEPSALLTRPQKAASASEGLSSLFLHPSSFWRDTGHKLLLHDKPIRLRTMRNNENF